MQTETKSGDGPRGMWQAAWDAMLVPALAILTAVVLGGIIIASVRGNPFLAYYGLIQGSFGSLKGLSETAVWATPYIFGGLAVALAFKGGLFNIGVEGQLALGAVATAPAGRSSRSASLPAARDDAHSMSVSTNRCPAAMTKYRSCQICTLTRRSTTRPAWPSSAPTGWPISCRAS